MTGADEYKSKVTGTDSQFVLINVPIFAKIDFEVSLNLIHEGAGNPARHSPPQSTVKNRSTFFRLHVNSKIKMPRTNWLRKVLTVLGSLLSAHPPSDLAFLCPSEMN